MIINSNDLSFNVYILIVSNNNNIIIIMVRIHNFFFINNNCFKQKLNIKPKPI